MTRFPLTSLLLSLTWASLAHAQPTDNYPSRPVSVVAAIAPGGGIDIESRQFTSRLGPLMGQPFVLDFKPGAAGTIGAAYVAKAKPDGYTLHVVAGGFTVFPAFYKDLAFDIVKDFAPISLLYERSSVLQLANNFPAKSFPEFIAYAKAHPGKVNYGTTGAGSITHLAGAWLADATGAKFTFVHYKGSGPLLLEMMAGRLDAGSGILSAGLPYVRSGKTRGIAILNNKRSKLLPNLPTVEEQGVPGYNYVNWLGFLAPAGAPAPVIGRLNDALVKITRSAEITEMLEKEGSIPVASSAAEFRAHLIAESARWKRIVTEAGIRLEE
jgi:tripartite-type tricarboxylate transporter receptor subunit TctC